MVKSAFSSLKIYGLRKIQMRYSAVQYNTSLKIYSVKRKYVVYHRWVNKELHILNGKRNLGGPGTWPSPCCVVVFCMCVKLWVYFKPHSFSTLTREPKSKIQVSFRYPAAQRMPQYSLSILHFRFFYICYL